MGRKVRKKPTYEPTAFKVDGKDFKLWIGAFQTN